jgi:hypothetical protein
MPPEHRVAALLAPDCTVCIPSDGAVTSAGGVTRYTVSVSSSEGSWTVERRYNAFSDLHNALATHLDRACAKQLMQCLPAKSATSLVKKSGPAQIEERRIGLNVYLQTVFSIQRLKHLGCSDAMAKSIRTGPTLSWFAVPEAPADHDADAESLTQKVAYMPGRVGTGVVDGVSDGATAIGTGVAGGVSAVGSGVAGGVSAVGSGVAGGVGTVGSGVVGGVNFVGSGVIGGVSYMGSSLGLRRSRKSSAATIPEGTPPASHVAAPVAQDGSAPIDVTQSSEPEPEPEPELEPLRPHSLLGTAAAELASGTAVATATGETLSSEALDMTQSGGEQLAGGRLGGVEDSSPTVTTSSDTLHPTASAGQASREMVGTLTVKARRKHESSLEVMAGSSLHWQFKLAAKDVGFTAKFLRQRVDGGPPADEQIVVPYSKILAEGGKVTGSFKPPSKGTLVFGWDNSYSKLTGKTVAYKLSFK